MFAGAAKVLILENIATDASLSLGVCHRNSKIGISSAKRGKIVFPPIPAAQLVYSTACDVIFL